MFSNHAIYTSIAWCIRQIKTAFEKWVPDNKLRHRLKLCFDELWPIWHVCIFADSPFPCTICLAKQNEDVILMSAAIFAMLWLFQSHFIGFMFNKTMKQQGYFSYK